MHVRQPVTHVTAPPRIPLGLLVARWLHLSILSAQPPAIPSQGLLHGLGWAGAPRLCPGTSGSTTESLALPGPSGIRGPGAGLFGK